MTLELYLMNFYLPRPEMNLGNREISIVARKKECLFLGHGGSPGVLISWTEDSSFQTGFPSGVPKKTDLLASIGAYPRWDLSVRDLPWNRWIVS